MKNLIKNFIPILIMLYIFQSCNKQDDDGKSTFGTQNKVQVMEEFAVLLGITLSDKNNREYVVNLIHDRNDNSEAITINALFNKDIPSFELNRLQISDNYSKRAQKEFNFFKNSIITEVELDIDKYPLLKNKIGKDVFAKKSSNAIYEEIANFYISQGLDIYFPYEENFILDNENKINITWDPLNGEDWNKGYEIPFDSSNKSTKTIISVDKMTDDFAYENPTLVVRPMMDMNDNYISVAPIDSDPWDGNIDPIEFPNNNQPSWSVKGWQGLLTFNVDHTKIQDDDILKVSIPKIRLMEHLGTWFTPTTITFVRSYAILKTNSVGVLEEPLEGDHFFICKKFNITRKNAREHNWVDFNAEFDNDWNMHESIVHLTFASHHTFSGALDFDGEVGLGYDKEKKKVVPNIDIKFKPRDVSIGSNARLEYSGEISRRGILAQIVGDTGQGTYNDNGTNYSIRTAGPRLQYYLKPYLTKIVD